jgi:transposase, IS30 family
MMSYKQITYEQRIVINQLKKLNYSNSSIADEIGVDKSTIGRELKRNSGQRGYRYNQAHAMTNARKRQRRQQNPIIDEYKLILITMSCDEWSPEQISGFLKHELNIYISHETIYQWIWADKRAGGELYKHLRHGQKKKRKRYGSKDARGQIKDRVSIDERPAIVDQRIRFGDWEIDTVIGANHQGALITAVERKSQFTCIEYVPNKEANLVSDRIVAMLWPYRGHVHTITIDNGKEFSDHKRIAEQLNVKIYFAHPYHSWERGLNEQVNGLIRQYFPKKTSFANITKEDTKHVEYKLNNRPRKRLNFQQPINYFLNSIVALGT